jgi:hypothetical protein
MLRPSLRDEYVRRRAAEIIFPKIRGWQLIPESEETDWMSDLASVARLADGYEIAHELERRHSWMADAQLVEILDGSWVRDAIDELTSQWVRCLDIRPKFEIGDRVVCRNRPEQAAVVNVDTRLAKYGVHYPDMKDNSWCVVEFEACTPVPALEAATA